jgi:hypothetical protein
MVIQNDLQKAVLRVFVPLALDKIINIEAEHLRGTRGNTKMEERWGLIGMELGIGWGISEMGRIICNNR